MFGNWGSEYWSEYHLNRYPKVLNEWCPSDTRHPLWYPPNTAPYPGSTKHTSTTTTQHGTFSTPLPQPPSHMWSKTQGLTQVGSSIGYISKFLQHHTFCCCSTCIIYLDNGASLISRQCSSYNLWSNHICCTCASCNRVSNFGLYKAFCQEVSLDYEMRDESLCEEVRWSRVVRELIRSTGFHSLLALEDELGVRADDVQPKSNIPVSVKIEWSRRWNRQNVFNLPQATNKCWTLWPCIWPLRLKKNGYQGIWEANLQPLGPIFQHLLISQCQCSSIY